MTWMDARAADLHAEAKRLEAEYKRIKLKADRRRGSERVDLLERLGDVSRRITEILSEADKLRNRTRI